MAATKRKTTAKPKKASTSTKKVTSKVTVKKTKAKTTTKTKTATPKKSAKAVKTTKPKAIKGKKIDKALTRAQQIAHISEETGFSKKEVTQVLDCYEPMIAAHLKGPGEISIAGWMKIRVVRKPATKARKGINPFTGEPTVFKAKPAKNVVKIRPLKKLQDMV